MGFPLLQGPIWPAWKILTEARSSSSPSKNVTVHVRDMVGPFRCESDQAVPRRLERRRHGRPGRVDVLLPYDRRRCTHRGAQLLREHRGALQASTFLTSLNA